MKGYYFWSLLSLFGMVICSCSSQDEHVPRPPVEVTAVTVVPTTVRQILNMWALRKVPIW